MNLLIIFNFILGLIGVNKSLKTLFLLDCNQYEAKFYKIMSHNGFVLDVIKLNSIKVIENLNVTVNFLLFDVRNVQKYAIVLNYDCKIAAQLLQTVIALFSTR